MIVVLVSVLVLLGALVLGWIVNDAIPWIRKHLSKTSQRVEQFLPHHMKPIEHFVLIIGVVLVTLLVHNFQEFAAWRNLVQPDDVEATAITMLALATTATAVLTFLTGYVRSLGKTEETERTYLGKRIDDYLSLRSATISFLGLPVFHLAVALLFVIPVILLITQFLQSWLTSLLVPISTGLINNARSCVLASWVSLLITVVAVLSFNLLAAFRSTALTSLRPGLVKHRIYLELQDEVKTDRKKILRITNPIEARNVTLDWSKQHLYEIGKLQSRNELLRYWTAVFGHTGFDKTIDKAVKRVKKTLRREFNQQAETITTQHSGLQRLKQATFRYIDNRRIRRLNFSLSLLEGELHSLLDSPTDLQNAYLRQWRLTAILRKSESLVANYSQLTATPPADPVVLDRRGDLIKEVHAMFLCRESAVPSLRKPYPRGRWIQQEPATLISISVLVFSELSSQIAAKSPILRADDMETIIDGAWHISHEPTRRFAAAKVLRAVLNRTIIFREDAETLPVDFLYDRFGSKHSRPAGNVPDLELPTITNAIANLAYYDLANGQVKEPKSMKALAELVHKQEIHSALLTQLFLANRQYKSVDHEVLIQFLEPLSDYQYGFANTDGLVPKTQERIRHSRISHFVSSEGIAWLYDAIKQPLSLDLCVQLLRNSKISNFGILELVQWHVLAGTDSYPSDKKVTTTGLEYQLAASRSSLEKFATAIKPLNSQAGSKIDMLLRQLPTRSNVQHL